MNKMLKIITMLLIIVSMVFLAGCASKPTSTNNTTGAQEQVTSNTSITSEGGNISETSAIVPTGPTVSNATNTNSDNQTESNVTINSDQNSPSDGGNGNVSQELLRRDKERDALNLSDNNTYENNTTV